jgi:hypothetical protein
MLIGIIALFVAAIAVPTHACDGCAVIKTNFNKLDPLFNALSAVESGHNDLVIGDNGAAIGRYQIHYDYWRDSGTPGRYENCTTDAYAKLVIYNYMKRHCPDALQRFDYETLARTHNGGPAGATKIDTVAYWRKVSRHLT